MRGGSVCIRPSFSPSRLKEKLGPGNETRKHDNPGMTFVKLLRFSLVWQALSEGLVCQTSFSSKPPNSRIVSICAEAPVFKDYLVFTQMRARDLFRGRARGLGNSPLISIGLWRGNATLWIGRTTIGSPEVDGLFSFSFSLFLFFIFQTVDYFDLSNSTGMRARSLRSWQGKEE